MSLGARILQVGGMPKISKYLLASVCYLSTTAGPIAGVHFISTEKVGFCNERMIKLSCPNGKSVRVIYKVAIPRAKIQTVNQSENTKRPLQKYQQWLQRTVSISGSWDS